MFIVHNKVNNQHAICNSKTSIAGFLNITYNGVLKAFNQNRLDNRKFHIILPDSIQLKGKKRGNSIGFKK
jgi:hypothetical protein